VITGIVLAAGTSSRLGRPKQLLELRGKPVVQHVIEAALTAGLDEVVVVVGHASNEVAAAVPMDDRVRVVTNPDYPEGQSTSLRAGLRAAGPRTLAAVVLLGDQPGVRADAIVALVDGWHSGSGPVVQASYGGRPTHPILLDRSVWHQVAEGAGDEGARSVLAEHPGWRSTVEVGGDPPEDIDTEEDYRRLLAAFDNQ
jgi:molybdenum cofactor cytidylyltransferase